MPLERGFDGPGPAVRRKKPGMRLLACNLSLKGTGYAIMADSLC